MRVNFCHHISLKYIGGGEKWIINTSKALRERDHEVKVYALPFVLKGKQDPNQIKLLDGIPYKESYFHHIKGAGISYVTYHPWSSLSFRIDGPKIAGIHAQVYDAKVKNYGLLPSLAKYANNLVGESELKKFDAVHCVSSLTKVKHPHTYFIPNFVDSKVYKPSVKPEEFTVAFASRHVWQKGYDIWQQLKPELEKIVVVKESGDIAEKNMPEFLGSAHVVLNCSRVDTFGLAIVESLMGGTPVVSSGLETHKALNVSGVFHVQRPEDYLTVIGWLKNRWLNNREEYNLICSMGRESALKYDTVKIVDQLENMFLEVAHYAHN
jgi:glycosyltransferase involved in cell wall biosynthesis